MPTPKQGYFLKDGTKVPGTTTILGRFKDSGGLMHWAFKQGQAGKSHLYEEAEKAADIGTVAHAMVEKHIHGMQDGDIAAYCMEALPDPEMQEKAFSSYRAFHAWEKNFAVEWIETEIPLVSEKYRYGGTLDALAIIGNELCLMDFKTSNSVYSDYLVQLAAYGNLVTECRGVELAGGFHLLRFSKENADFAHHRFADLSEAWRQFQLFREAYDIDKVLKKRAA